MRRAFGCLVSLLILPSCMGGGSAGGRTIKVGSTASGSLTDDDPLMRNNRGPYQIWVVQGKRGQRLAIEMNSSAFDAYLYVRDSDGFLIGQDDDGGEGNNARVRTILPRNGHYRIIATSYGPTARGDYSLAVSEWPAPEAPSPGSEQTLSVGDSRDGLLEPGDEVSGDGPYQDRWTFEATAGQRVRVEMASTDVDSYLILLGPDGRVVATNDDALGRDAGITLRPEQSGRYTALATTYGDVPRMGAYRIALKAVTGEFAEPGRVQQISDGQNVEGQLEAGDSTTAGGGYVDVYQYRPAAAGTATIEMASNAFDSYLTLQDSTGATLGTDDDSGGDRNARLVHPVAAGALYRVLAGAYGSGASGGAYRLSVRVSQP
jgi:hypothetical protein